MTAGQAYTPYLLLFFFNDTATTEIYTLSLHDALPIFHAWARNYQRQRRGVKAQPCVEDRKSTRLNSSHVEMSYAVFCLKKKKGTVSGYELSLRKMKGMLRNELALRFVT